MKVISFFGHSFLKLSNNLENTIFKILKEVLDGEYVVFYLGDYGSFDDFARNCCLKYKEKYNNAKLCFVTPYIDEAYLKNREPLKRGYDEIIYPDLEFCPKRLAIIKRNEWIVEQSDYIIVYVEHSWGGASKALEYAKKRNKKYINIAKKQQPN